MGKVVPPLAQCPQLTDDHITAYEKALDALLASDWGTAIQLLHQVPAQDRVKDFITVFIAQHNRTPPRPLGRRNPAGGEVEFPAKTCNCVAPLAIAPSVNH